MLLRRFKSVKLLNSVTPPIAVDLGVKTIKVLQLTDGDSPALIAAAEAEIPDEMSTDSAERFRHQLEVMPRLIKEGGFKGKRVVCSIPAPMMFCKHMRFARTEGVSLAEMVRTAVPAEIGCHPDALLYRHVEVGEVANQGGGAKTEVICLATRRDMVQRIMGALSGAKLEPVGLTPECLAIVQGFDANNRAEGDEGKTTLYLDLGAGTTQVLMVRDGQLVFAKNIHMAGCHLDHAISQQLKCSLLQARSRRLATPKFVRRGAPHPAPVGAGPGAPGASGDDAGSEGRSFDVSEQLETMTDEIAMCLRYHESVFPGKRADRLVFVGGESRHLAMCEHTARTLRLPAQVADPLARVAKTGSEPCDGVDVNVPQPGWAVVYGLARCPTDL